MILVGPNGDAIMTGKVTSAGGELKYIGKNKVPVYSFSIMVSFHKDENNEWKTKYIDCEVFGAAMGRAPKLIGSEFVLCTGKYSRYNWKRTDGQTKICERLKCDGVMLFGGKLWPEGDVRDLLPKEKREELYTVNGEDLMSTNFETE